MNRIFFLCATLLLLVGQQALAAEGDLYRISVGPSLMYDGMDQEAGAGGHMTLGYRVKPNLEVELYGAKSAMFGVENDLTRGDASVSMLTIGGRYLSTLDHHSVGYISFGLGVLALDADDVSDMADDSRVGGVARFGVGVDFPITSRLGMTCGAGFNRGLGSTDEVVLFDLTASLFTTF